MRSRKKKTFNILPFLILAIFIILILGLLYFLFEKPSSITCGILLEKKINQTSMDIKLGYKDTTKWIKVTKKMGLPQGSVFSVKMKGIIVTSIKPCKTFTGKVYAKSSSTLLLDDKRLKFDKIVYYYRIKNGKLIQLKSNSVVVGTSESTFIENNNLINSVIVNSPILNDIRVGISNYNFTSLSHYNLMMHCLGGLIVKYADGTTFKIKNDYLGISYAKGYMTISDYSKVKSTVAFKANMSKTNKRFFIYSALGNPIWVDTLKREQGTFEYIPKYYGSFEVYTANNSMRLINEVNIEDYLRFVVPSEMLSSGGVEGYKVQAVAARTYVLSDMLTGRFAKYGFHVDDSTQSQVYNALPSNAICDNAIKATTGEVLTYDNKIIDAKYYSTSCGVGAPYNEVWYNSNISSTNQEPYLTFNNFSSTNTTDLSTDSAISNFLKDWTIKAYDSNSPYFRWKYNIDMKSFTKIINKNIYLYYTKNPNNYKKKVIFNYYKQAKITKEGIGNITDIYVSKRGLAGNALELIITADTGTYKIKKEFNLKKLLISRDIEITPLYGSGITDSTTLPSDFFVIDKEMENSKIKTVTIYGGGYGHGVGMSQYGAIGLVRLGKNYKDILNTFYKGVTFDSYETALSNYFN